MPFISWQISTYLFQTYSSIDLLVVIGASAVLFVSLPFPKPQRKCTAFVGQARMHIPHLMHSL